MLGPRIDHTSDTAAMQPASCPLRPFLRGLDGSHADCCCCFCCRVLFFFSAVGSFLTFCAARFWSWYSLVQSKHSSSLYDRSSTTSYAHLYDVAINPSSCILLVCMNRGAAAVVSQHVKCPIYTPRSCCLFVLYRVVNEKRFSFFFPCC